MTCSPAQRARINQQNAARSTGPRSVAGKSISSMNALKHGLRADSPALPGENPLLAAQRADAWDRYYRPASPAAQHLVNACVAATLLFDRTVRYHAAVLARQVRDKEYQYDRANKVDSAPAAAPTCPEL